MLGRCRHNEIDATINGVATLGSLAPFGLFSTSAYGADDSLDAGYALIGTFLLFAAIIYELPAIIAFARGHPNRWLILVRCTALAGTGIVWLGCLIWAFKALHLADDPSGWRRVRFESCCQRRSAGAAGGFTDVHTSGYIATNVPRPH
ncbi:hypothetical protein CN311_16085 [Mesorhizobium sanjuanii]|uniref:Uncharacterized protein n=1 Tax=Mesorhizobium sanjuanii TaxID=2037900 RepID=A0A2A6FE24_9HYPH|nr:hypothetical protein CN311_16085 [Mesorhizobium sanjuanii]